MLHRRPQHRRAVAPSQPTGRTSAEQALHRQIADLLTLELAPAGKLSPHGVVW